MDLVYLKSGEIEASQSRSDSIESLLEIMHSPSRMIRQMLLLRRSSMTSLSAPRSWTTSRNRYWKFQNSSFG